MTYRERREAKIEKLREWAEKRENAANQVLKSGEKYRGDYAFNTQPGHIPERARLIASQDRAFESLKKAEGMEARADGIATQLDRSVYSDDVNAIEALEARIAEREKKRDRMKHVNALYRKADVAALADLGLDYEAIKAKIDKAYSWEKAPYVGWELTNLGATIRADKERIKQIQAMQARTEKAAAAPHGVLIEGTDYVRVTFPEKPDRAIINDLKAAGFYWGSGSWNGSRAKLPASVVQP